MDTERIQPDDNQPLPLRGSTIPEPEDVDPSQWLGHLDSTATDSYMLPDGKRLKFAAITDREEVQIRELSKRLNKRTKKIGVDFTQYKREMVVASLNKASGKQPHEDGFVVADQMGAVPTGQLAEMLKFVMELSGMNFDNEGVAASAELFT